MVFLISLALALAIIALWGGAIKTRPLPFYGVAAALSLASAAAQWAGTQNSFFISLFSGGGLAGAFFVIVMWTGALPNGSWAIKKLMPIRGQLSILASILALGHGAVYIKAHMTKLLAGNYELLAAFICSIFAVIIMTPLFVTSFQTVRRKMAAKRWKRLQRWAYAFYALFYGHIVLFLLPRARAGGEARFSLLIYTLVFAQYFVSRVAKALAIRGKLTGPMAAIKTWVVPICAVVICIYAASGVPADAQSLPDGVYADGVYAGGAMGMNGQIEVEVTVVGGKITVVDILSAHDDEPYFSDGLTVIDDILASNGVEVDVVTGATYSSGGIIDAVADALSKAK